MGGVGFQRLLQCRCHPIADRLAILSRSAAHLPDQRTWQLDGEDSLAFRNRHGRRSFLGKLHISMRLPCRDAVSASKPLNHLRWRQVLLQALDGVIHTADMLGGRRSIQWDT